MTESLKIYFACAIRGEQGGAEDKEAVVRTLQDLGHNVLSEIFLGQDINVNELGQMTPPEICDRDLDWIEEADVVVAEVSKLSHGVGFELGWAASRGKRAVMLCHQERYTPLSNMLKGAPLSRLLKQGQFSLHTWNGYEDSERLISILESELGRAV